MTRPGQEILLVNLISEDVVFKILSSSSGIMIPLAQVYPESDRFLDQPDGCSLTEIHTNNISLFGENIG